MNVINIIYLSFLFDLTKEKLDSLVFFKKIKIKLYSLKNM